MTACVNAFLCGRAQRLSTLTFFVMLFPVWNAVGFFVAITQFYWECHNVCACIECGNNRDYSTYPVKIREIQVRSFECRNTHDKKNEWSLSRWALGSSLWARTPICQNSWIDANVVNCPSGYDEAKHVCQCMSVYDSCGHIDSYLKQCASIVVPRRCPCSAMCFVFARIKFKFHVVSFPVNV